jgi:hypothetical protein
MRRLHLTRATKLLGAVGLLCAAATTVEAKSINLHTLSNDSNYAFSDFVQPGKTFTDYVRFRLSDATEVQSFVASLGFSSFSTALQSQGRHGYTTLSLTTGSTSTFNDLLTPGTYRLAIGGKASSFSAGMYAGTLHVAAVPEADTWVMLLVGLGVVGYQLRRKQRSLEQQNSLLA